MTITPTEPVAVAQRTFRTLLTAMANPGSVHFLSPRPGESPEESVAFALVDHEVAFAVVGESRVTGAVPVARRITVRTGSSEAAVPEAAFIFAYGALPKAAWATVRCGTLAYPDQGATILYRLPAIGVRAALSKPVRLRLSGPGIEHDVWLSLAGLPAGEFAARNAACRDYPMGIDCIFVDSAGQVACVPRSSTIETVEEG